MLELKRRGQHSHVPQRTFQLHSEVIRMQEKIKRAMHFTLKALERRKKIKCKTLKKQKTTFIPQSTKPQVVIKTLTIWTIRNLFGKKVSTYLKDMVRESRKLLKKDHVQ